MKASYPNEFKYYQVIDLPNKITTPGCNDLRSHVNRFAFDDNLFRGKRVLDVATNDGFWAFKAIDFGAKYVKGIDVDFFEQYDWSYGGVPEGYKGQTNNRQVFDWINEEFNYGVIRETKSIYDLDKNIDGIFDISICYGLFYHLRPPLLGLDKLRYVTSGATIIQTNVSYIAEPLPVDIFVLDDVWNGITNWTMTSLHGFIHYMKSAGFKEIFIDKIGRPTTQNWQPRIFVGCVSDDMVDYFSKIESLKKIDQNYFLESRKAIKDIVLKR